MDTNNLLEYKNTVPTKTETLRKNNQEIHKTEHNIQEMCHNIGILNKQMK